jgi:hypothetical protein
MWAYGPVLAIGDPSRKSKPATLGAARDYVDDSTWHQKAIELMDNAAMIVVVVGATQGLAWEIDTIASRGLLSKLVLLVTPMTVPKIRQRWQALAGYSNLLPGQIDFAHARALVFAEGAPALIVGKQRNDWTYEAALDEAALIIAEQRDAARTTAPCLQHPSRDRRRAKPSVPSPQTWPASRPMCSW